MKSIKIQYRLLLLLLPTLVSCGTNSLTGEELNAWLLDPENGLSKTQEIGKYKVGLTYRPSEFLVQQDMAGRKNNDSLKAYLQGQYGQYLYFILELSYNNKEFIQRGGGNPESFSRDVQQLAHGLYDKVYLTTSESDTVPLADFVFPRMFGMTSSNNILLAFEASNVLDAPRFNIHLSRLISDYHQQLFHFNTSAIRQAPRLRSIINKQL